MYKNKRTRVGSEAQYGPRIVGEILHAYLENSNEPLAVAYREHTSETNLLFEDIYPHTELEIELKLMTREPGRKPMGAYFKTFATRHLRNCSSLLAL